MAYLFLNSQVFANFIQSYQCHEINEKEKNKNFKTWMFHLIKNNLKFEKKFFKLVNFF